MVNRFTFFVLSVSCASGVFAAGTATTTTLVSSALTAAVYGAPLTLTAQISAGAATGKVTFYDDATVLGTAPVTAGKATLSTIGLPAGKRRLTAFYSGDSANAASVSVAFAQTVNAVPGTGFNIVASPHDAGATPSFVLAADFNGDGKADLAAANTDSNDVSILLGRGDGTFRNPVSYPVGVTPIALAAADLNGDGKTDLIVANSAGGDLSILLGNGNGTFAAAVSVPVGGSPNSIAVSDFNGDGIPDLTVANGATTIGVLLGKGDGTFQAPVNYATGAGPKAIAASDLNADGRPDIVTANSGGQNVSVLLGVGDGTFRPANNYPAGDACVALALADFNGDSKTDLAVVGGAKGARILAGNGDGSFGAPVVYDPSGYAIVTADFNGDGKIDLATAAFRVEESFGNGDGSFQPLTVYETPGAALYGIAIADFNGDGRADIVTANGPDNNITVLLGAPFAITGVSNAAGGGTTVQPGSWVAIYGSGLALSTRVWGASDFVGSALPTNIDSVTVKIDNKAAAIFFVSPDQVNVQAPADTSAGKVTVQLMNSYGTATGSVTLQPYAPAFFAYLAKYPVAVHLDGTYVAPINAFGGTVSSRPAKPGETIVLFGTGFGPTTPAIPPGQIVSGFANLADPTALRIRIGGTEATVPFAGLVAAGEFQFNVTVPFGLSNGDQAIVADIGGQSSQPLLFIPVQN
jgi:uncharacterized protein (TIGR03437 family)